MSVDAEIVPAVPVIDRAELAPPLRELPLEDLRRLTSPNMDGPVLLPNGDREFICSDCGRRCTAGSDGVEYGHQRNRGSNGTERCPRRPGVVDPGDPRGHPAVEGI